MFVKLEEKEPRKQNWNDEKQLLENPFCAMSLFPFFDLLHLAKHNHL
jgi:hypothetical protein